MEPEPATIAASYAVHGSTVQDVKQGNIAGLSLEQIAALVDANAPGISLCHQCDDQVSDPELGDISAMTINGVYYELVDGVWQKSGE